MPSISFRCNEEFKQNIERKAEKLYGKKNKTSEFIKDCVEEGLKRQTKKDKNYVRALVENQEHLNQLILNTQDVEMKNKLNEYSKGTIKLWDN